MQETSWAVARLDRRIVAWMQANGHLLLLLQMPGTMLPLLLLPERCWFAPFVPTLEGQYIIIKNLVRAIRGARFSGPRS